MRQHRPPAKGHRRRGLAGQHLEQRTAGAQSSLVDVDMRVGLVAGDHVAVLGQAVVQVGVHVERDADRHGGDLAQTAQQLAFAVLVGPGHHRAVQVEQHAIATLGHCVANALDDVLEGRVFHRTAGRGVGGDRHHVVGASGFGELDEGGDRRAGATVGSNGCVAFGRCGR